jgi:hypothetical protein
MASPNLNPGMYNTEYFSGAQCAVYIGDVWVDEITSISWSVSQSRAPLYGYADTLFRDVAKGRVLVQGTFTINFKEAGYLFLILDRYRKIMKNQSSIMGVDTGQKIKGTKGTGPFLSSSLATRETIESLVDGTMGAYQRNQQLRALAEHDAKQTISSKQEKAIALGAAASLGGYASIIRGAGGIGASENAFETFEDMIWGKTQEQLDGDTRRADDARLSPFDIYVSFGDFAADNSVNHTIQKLSNVYIIGSAKEVIIDGQPIQEQYSFFARNQV